MSIGIMPPLILGRIDTRFDDRQYDCGASLSRTAKELRQVMDNLRDLDDARVASAVSTTLASDRAALDQIEDPQAHLDKNGRRVHAVIETLKAAANQVSALVGKIGPGGMTQRTCS